MKDLALDTITHELTFENYDFAFVEGLEYLAQKLKIRLLFFLSEWFLDTAIGVPFYNSILVKNPNVPHIDVILKTVILGTDGVEELVSYQSDYDNSIRKLSVDFEARTIFGTLTFSETLP